MLGEKDEKSLGKRDEIKVIKFLSPFQKFTKAPGQIEFKLDETSYGLWFYNVRIDVQSRFDKNRDL